MLEGRVGDKILGKPYGLLRGSWTGDSIGGRPCGVAFEGLDLSTVLDSSASMCLVEGAVDRGGN